MGEQVRLCQVVQGVEFTVDEQGVQIRALILRDALENFFGASESPQSWLKAYKTHRDAIDCAAADTFRAQSEQGIVVLRGNRPEDFTHVRTVAPLPLGALPEARTEQPPRFARHVAL
ncbi:MAG TPA: DUF1488 family protein [Albitalea sp.]|nr:DUF1488 family protein [Albitalea sp.]